MANQISRDGVAELQKNIKNPLVSIFDKFQASGKLSFEDIRDEFDWMMKFDNTAPTTGATIYSAKSPESVTILGPILLAGFILAPVNLPNEYAKIPTIIPTPSASVGSDTSWLTSTCIEYINRNVIHISIIIASE